MRSSCLLLTLLLVAPLFAQQAVPVIPLKPDPPIAIDGDLKEWAGVPNAISAVGKEHATYIPSKWQGDADLSAGVHIAWRQEGLYLGLDIADSAICQTQHNEKMYQGDHLEIFIDTQPEVDPERRTFGLGQFQFGFSPGNFRQTGDPLTDIKPEVISYQPKDGPTTGIRFAAARTEKGYILEALIPFALLGVRPLQDLPLGLEVALSDCDSPEPAQEKMVTIGTTPWEYSRLRLPLFVLGDVAGKGVPPPRTVKIADEIVVKPGESQEMPVPPLNVQTGKDGYLFFKARIPFDKPAGYNPAMTAWLNGTALGKDRVTNRPAQSKRNEGTVHPFITGEGLIYVPYGPDFVASDSSPDYGLADGTKVHEWQFRITDLLKANGNVLRVSNYTNTNVKLDLILGQVELRVMAPPPPPKAKRPAPTGPLTVCEPRHWPTDLVGKPVLGDGEITLTLPGDTYTVTSRFSTPDGKWVTGASPFFAYSRTVEPKGCYLLVHDTFRNLTTDNLPLLQRHSCDLKDRGKQFWCSGISPASGEIAMSDPQNPTSYAATERSGIGFMPLNDEFLVHVTNSSMGHVLGLSDNNLVLQPGKEYRAEWVIVLTDRPDFWDFVNLARDIRGANFTLPWMFAFLNHAPRSTQWSDERFQTFMRNRCVNVVAASIDYPRYKGHYSHGTAFQHVDLGSYKEWTDRVRRLAPGVKTQVYFHCFLDVLDDADTLYPDARTLLSNGQQANYGEPYDREFIPTLTNSFGRDIARNVDLILDTCKADGVYWDEMDYSAYKYHFGEPWDGCTADIDPQTGRITRLKSSTTLLSQPFRKQLAEKIMARGPLVCNGAPHTRTMLALHYQAFVETAAISNCLRTILYSPVALGDHISERKQIDSYRWMTDALNYGCLYSWYPDNFEAENETLTKYMFPSTPLELHEGYLIAEERIVTNRSGLFGWGDASKHEVHVFNDEGREASEFKAPTLLRDGKTYTELRLAEGWTAAIVRE
jgi:hypothetical protein